MQCLNRYDICIYYILGWDEAENQLTRCSPNAMLSFRDFHYKFLRMLSVIAENTSQSIHLSHHIWFMMVMIHTYTISSIYMHASQQDKNQSFFYVISMRISHTIRISFTLCISLSCDDNITKLYKSKKGNKCSPSSCMKKEKCRWCEYVSFNWIYEHVKGENEKEKKWMNGVNVTTSISLTILIGHAWIWKIALRITIARWLNQYIQICVDFLFHF